jgi:signal transduction histidine kinase
MRAMKNRKISLSVKISSLVMIVSLLGIGTLAYISFSQAKDIFIENTSSILAKNIDQYAARIKDEIQKLKYNVTIFTYNPSVKGFMRAYASKYKYDEITNKTFSQYERDINAIVTLMMKQNRSYFQIRVIDANNGKEIIKLVKSGDEIHKITKNNLQNKFDTAYVQDTLELGDNDIYLSKINLNKEHKTIEFPIKPTIRIAKVIFTNKNNKTGIAVINANIKKLFDFKALRELKDTKTYIINDKGYYLFNYDNPDKEFGFEFGNDFLAEYDFAILRNFLHSDETKLSYVDNKKDIILEARKVYITQDRFIVVLKTTTTLAFKNKSQDYTKNLIVSIILITLFITMVTTILVMRITNPIKKLTELAKKIAQTKGKEHIDINVQSNDEIGELAKTFEIMIEVLDKNKQEIENFAQNLEKEVEKKTKELQTINENLQKIVDEKVSEVRDKDKVLSQQSKMAAMGEMIGSIAHQWRQPLNSLAINIQMLEDMAMDNELDEKTISEFVEKNMQTIQFMSNTIDDFRNFFRKDKEAIRFNQKEAVLTTLNLQKAQLKSHNIEVEVDLQDAYVKGFKNEFMQAVLNLISNAKDAIEERRKKIDREFVGKITISNEIKDGNVILSVSDNAGGIPDEIMERVFEPYFTTKEEGKGTGMGLYMVKGIIEKMNGKIEVMNDDVGAKFIIIMELDNE